MSDLKKQLKVKTVNAVHWLEKAALIINTERLAPIVKVFDPKLREPKYEILNSYIEGARMAVGQCRYVEGSKDGVTTHILIKPIFGPSNSKKILGILLHELVHAWIGQKPDYRGHGKPFRTVATRAGLTSPMRATGESDDLNAWFEAEIIKRLGEFPSLGLKGPNPNPNPTPGLPPEILKIITHIPKQTTRNLKMTCTKTLDPDCTFRGSSTQIHVNNFKPEHFKCWCCGSPMQMG